VITTVIFIFLFVKLFLGLLNNITEYCCLFASSFWYTKHVVDNKEMKLVTTDLCIGLIQNQCVIYTNGLWGILYSWMGAGIGECFLSILWEYLNTYLKCRYGQLLFEVNFELSVRIFDLFAANLKYSSRMARGRSIGPRPTLNLQFLFTIGLTQSTNPITRVVYVAANLIYRLNVILAHQVG